MLYETKIRLLSSMLGATRTHTKVRRFDRTRKGHLQVDENLWRWAIDQAVESLHLEVDSEAISLPPEIRAPRIDLYTRTFRRPGVIRPLTEDFECITKGAVLTFYLQVFSSLPEKKTNSPGRVELQQIFTYIGQLIGISPFGRKYDHGRFTVESVVALENIHDIPTEFYRR